MYASVYLYVYACVCVCVHVCVNLRMHMCRRALLSFCAYAYMYVSSVAAAADAGKTFCPPGGKKLTFFLDDMSMPLVNEWGDQITLELVRQVIEQGGVYFLDKDKRGDFKTIEGLNFIGAMNHPGGGRNDIPNRCKSKFFSINMIAPAVMSIDNIYGSMIKAVYNEKSKLSKQVRSSSIVVLLCH
eukprot:GHVU01215517.1.p1 GENE.GHVU01215517.1~~GHVU01215517.1.p1  ORF type:complete len:185 (-),score=27.73 GHVU01215517.1:170-724(-)